jgi:hypothetical protein
LLPAPESGQGNQSSEHASAQSQDGIGSEHDPNLSGAASRLPSKKREVAVSGVQGQGPSRSEVIYGAAERGFAQRSYKRVYGDYSRVMEEVMDGEQIPPGMRYYVKRYFNLIKPRE